MVSQQESNVDGKCKFYGEWAEIRKLAEIIMPSSTSSGLHSQREHTSQSEAAAHAQQQLEQQRRCHHGEEPSLESELRTQNSDMIYSTQKCTKNGLNKSYTWFIWQHISQYDNLVYTGARWETFSQRKKMTDCTEATRDADGN